MKRLKAWTIGALAALITSIAFGATLSPVALINPAGSTAGQAIISTGASTAPAWGAVPLTGITGTLAIANGGTGATTAAAARTNLGLGTAATASTGTSGATVPLLNGANTWSAAQAFTALITPTSTVGIKGTTTNDGTAAGSWGEYLTATTSTTSMTTATATACTSISLSAGDWDVSGQVTFVPAGTTTVGSLQAGINTTVASSTGPNGQFQTLTLTFGTGNTQQLATPVVRESLSATTTIYLVGQATFGTSTMTCNGWIRARRVR